MYQKDTRNFYVWRDEMPTITNSKSVSKTKVLFFLGYPLPFPGAAWVRIEFMAKYLTHNGVQSAILGVFTPKSLRKASIHRHQGYDVINLCPAVCNSWGFVFNLVSSIIIFFLLFLIKKPTDVIISAPSALNEQLMGVFMASKMYGSRAIFDYRDPWEDYNLSKASSRLPRLFYNLLKKVATSIYLQSALVLTVTPPLLEHLKRRGIKNVRLIPNGADLTVFKPYNKLVIRKKLGLNPDDFIAIYSGSIGDYYRLDIIVKALSELQKSIKNIKFLIVGHGRCLSQVLKLSSDLGLNRKVIYLGVKNDKNELAEILSSADVGFIPYDNNILWKNTLPAKFFEYCACGIPVIATVYEDSILAKLIREHKVGLTALPMEVDELTETIYRFYKNKSFRKASGKRARALIEEMFDRNKISDRFLGLLEQVAHSSG